MKYKDLLFDVDDTLLDFGKDEHQAIIHTFETLGIEPNDTNINLYVAINAPLWELHNQGKFPKSAIPKMRFAYTLSVLQHDDIDPMEAANTYIEALAHTGNLFDNVIETLLQLKQQGYRLHLITNGFTYIQTNRLSRSGLDKIVDNVFISEAIGHNKPDVAFLNYVANHIDNFNPNEALIIGDSYSSDIKLGLNNDIDTLAISSKPVKDATYQLNHVKNIFTILN